MAYLNRRRLTTAICIAILLTFGYPLSIGPSTWLSDRGWLPKSTVRALYAPLFWAYNRSPGSVQTAADSYIDLWSKKAPDKGIIFDPVLESVSVD